MKRSQSNISITGGKYKGRKILSLDTIMRPTKAIVRESIGNILTHSSFAGLLENAIVLDVFCGTGSMSFEFISRGAKKCIMIDIDTLNATINKDKFPDSDMLILKSDINFLPTIQDPIDLVFIDPPYDKTDLIETAINQISKKANLKNGALVIIETHKTNNINYSFKEYKLIFERRYGISNLYFLCFEGSDVIV